MRNEGRILDSDRIDQLVSAEIPNPQLEPELYEIVTKNMIHGPFCTELDPPAPCVINGKCSKNFPKPFYDQTIITDNGKVIYRRRNNGRTITVRLNNREFIVDNRWVVPYNPYCLLKYNCHINIDVCVSVRCVKYLYKYFFKGVDQALIRINQYVQDYDEVESFLNGRYMSPPEASWHLNQFPLYKNAHTVYRLCVHLPERQVVRFQPGFVREVLQHNETTQLTAWFVLNENDAEANQYLYTEIPYHYVWQNNQKRWKRRQRGADKIIVRMYNVNVRNQELYYFRLLLLHVRGARSFQDVRTVDNVTYDTFLEACQHRNLLTDDTEWRRALTEAGKRQMPSQLRSMFAYMLIYCDISNKLALWEEFKKSFIEDFIRNEIPRDVAIDNALTAIHAILLLNGVRLSEFRLPEPANIIRNDDPVNIEVEKNEGEIMRNRLNPEQTFIFETVLNAVNNVQEPSKLFLINAAAGCGKTFLFQTIRFFRGEGKSLFGSGPHWNRSQFIEGGSNYPLQI